MPPAIRCTNLFKTYPGKPPVEAVRGIDFEVNVGECYGVLGPNGAGKTTTIEILEGLLSASSGEALLFDMSWDKHAGEIKERIGVSLQETRLSERLFRKRKRLGSKRSPEVKNNGLPLLQRSLATRS